MQKIDFDWVIRTAITIIPPLALSVYVIKRIYGFLYGDQDGQTADFLYYWVGSSLVLNGNANTVYDFAAFQTILEHTAGKPFPVAWFYPPVYLLFVFPLALMPYHVALATWLVLPLSGILLLLYRIAPHRQTVLLSMAFPATLLNIDYGQNGLLSAALLGWGLFQLDRRPIVAGVFFGLLGYKPHLAALIPLVLVAGRNWSTLIATIMTFLFTSLVSVIVFGQDIWFNFFSISAAAVSVLDTGHLGFIQDWAIMVTPFSMARLLGLPLTLASILQGAIMALACGLTLWVWFRCESTPIKGSVLALCALLFSPHAFEYDLVILLLPMAWIGWAGNTKGWLPGEKAMLILAWIAPYISKVTINLASFQIMPLVITGLLIVVLRRALASPAPMATPLGSETRVAGTL